MSRCWEYAQLRLTCDPGAQAIPMYGWLAVGDNTVWQELGQLASAMPVIARLGSEGWELIGPPASLNAVFTYRAANDTWHDRAYWVQREFWFKREKAR
jgi:hypothetical protein